MEDTIILECTKCESVLSTMRDKQLDPPEAVKMVGICPDCDSGDFDEPMYFDAAGNHIVRDWMNT